ncbi:hypothetical protein DUNSADRAFT_2654 [Dunaliella salina]|uniref:Uncharacterized protein n=1 Tax=Dunaliella salina TaxID=3046 RepID=A0ABQ7H861_DUNSA|nr:hypothetical protein DUNSADRAFT_2654 [Dunaliella salina]|eukprot:KAF5843041.1 hypothetical protein DUNSADRAFT_2654 [Dunaliella salina]
MLSAFPCAHPHEYESGSGGCSCRHLVRHAQSRLEDALEAARADAQRLTQEVAGLRQAREEADAEAARMASEMVSVKEQVRAHAARVATLEQEVQRHEEAAASVSAQLQTAQKQLAQQQESLAQAEDRSHKDRSKRQRVEEESKSLATRVEKLRRANSGGPGGASGDTLRELSEELWSCAEDVQLCSCPEGVQHTNTSMYKCGNYTRPSISPSVVPRGACFHKCHNWAGCGENCRASSGRATGHALCLESGAGNAWRSPELGRCFLRQP